MPHGLAFSRSPDLDQIAAETLTLRGVAPAAAIGWARWVGSAFVGAVGAHGTVDGRPGGDRRVTPDTPFDLASITKSFVALTAARLVSRGHLSWCDPLAAHLPELAGTHGGRQTLERLLSHRGGLVPHLETFEPWRSRRVVGLAPLLRRLAIATPRRPPLSSEGDAHDVAVYSDLGYMLVGAALERAAGRDLDELVADEVLTPLALEVGSVRQWLAGGRPITDFAPTEFVAWRGGSLQGVVHDENAWVLAGHGLAGHAGLFGTVRALLRLGLELLRAEGGRSPWLEQSVLRHMLAPRAGGTHRVGFDTKSRGRSAAGQRSGDRTFGHLGFTGTSIWCDPAVGVASVMLTNRVRPSRNNVLIRDARPQVHDLLLSHALDR